MCPNCGQSESQCNCPSNVCVPCSRDKNCPIKLDSSCVIYHIEGDDDTASQLTCLGLPNYTSVETILERLDDLVCNGLNTPLVVQDTFTVDLTATGVANHHLKADVKVSDDANNLIEIRPDGLFVNTPSGETSLVATDSTSIDFTTSGTAGHSLTGVVKISPDAGNGLSIHANGLFSVQTTETALTVNDSSTIDFTASGTSNHTLTGAVKVSPDSGNIISAHANGIYAGASDSLTFTNGLTRTVDDVQIGGTLLHDTTITATNTTANAFAINSTVAIDNNEYTNFTGFLIRQGGAFTQTDNKGADYGIGGQLWYKPTGTLSLRTALASFSGIYGIAIKSGAGNTSGNILSGGYFTAAVADAGNVESLAGVRIGHVIDPPSFFGAAFSGSITNYYGLYIEDAKVSIGSPANTYGAYILGAGSGFENVVVTDWTVTSDERIKENIIDTRYGLSEIEKLRVVEFNYKTDSTKDKQIGFIAQEVEQIISEAVSKKPIDGIEDFRLLDKNVIFSILVNAIKELSARVKELENK